MTEEITLVVSYETMVIVNPDLGEEETQKELERVKGLIKELGGKVTHEDVWGMRDLAYTIKHQDRGFYVVFNFNLEPSKLKEFDADMRLDAKVLRFVIIKTPKNYERLEFKDLEKEFKKYERPAKTTARTPSAPRAQEPAPAPSAIEKPVVKHVEKPVSKPAPAPVVEEEAPKKVKKEEPAEEKEPEPEVEAPKKKKEEVKLSDKSELEDVDAKLKSIIDDPDITL